LIRFHHAAALSAIGKAATLVMSALEGQAEAMKNLTSCHFAEGIIKSNTQSAFSLLLADMALF